MKTWEKILMVFVAVLVLSGFLMLLKPIRERVVWRVEQARARIGAVLFPEKEVVFVPQQEAVAAAVQSTMAAAQLADPTPSTTVAATATPAPDLPTPTTGPTATPLPSSMLLSGIVYEDQHGMWNYCAPSTLAMALSYWGWEGDRMVTGKYLKPFDEDLNVMPYEMANFVTDQTQLQAVVRSGGTLELLKKLVAGGFPVVIEKGTLIRETTTGVITWMGHYNIIVGYDDATNEFTTRDSYFSPPQYPVDYKIPYADIQKEWQGFNYVYVVIYPPDQQDRLFSILGDSADEASAYNIALQTATKETSSLTGADQFFAWYNRATSLVGLQDYVGAAGAYDQAFNYLAALPEDQVPKKIMRVVWYQTGPYFAYFYSGRYQDVINLADTTLKMPSGGPYLEESWYWKARAEVALGDNTTAIADLQESIKYHAGFAPSVDLLQQLGY